MRWHKNECLSYFLLQFAEAACFGSELWCFGVLGMEFGVENRKLVSLALERQVGWQDDHRKW